MKSIFWMKSVSLASLFLIIGSVGKLQGQKICISIANLTTTATTVEFDVTVRSMGPGVIKLGALGGGLQYAAEIGGTIATGNNVGFTVVSQPAGGAFRGFNNFGTNVNHTNTDRLQRHVRWTHTPSLETSGYVELSKSQPLTLGRFKMTSSTPWAVTPNASHFSLAPFESGYSAPQATITFNGNPVQTITVPNIVLLSDVKASRAGVYPSPTASYVSVSFESQEDDAVTLQLFDFNGRLVLQQDVLATKGANLSEVDMTSLQAGTYSVRVIGSEYVSAPMKVVKQ